MKLFFETKAEVALCVNEVLKRLRPSSVLTMTIIRDMSGVYCVTTATVELLADTVLPQLSLKPLTNTSPPNTPDG